MAATFGQFPANFRFSGALGMILFGYQVHCHIKFVAKFCGFKYRLFSQSWAGVIVGTISILLMDT